MEEDVVSIDAILCDCYQDEAPKTWQDRVKQGLTVAFIVVVATLVGGLALVGALDMALGMLISLS